MAWQPFTKRHQPPPDTLSYEIPERVRNRIFTVLEEGTRWLYRSQLAVTELLHEATNAFHRRHGEVFVRTTRGVRPKDDRAFEHFYATNDDEFIALLEYVFRAEHYSLGQLGVDNINEIFKEEGIGYAFTPWLETQSVAHMKKVVTQYPDGMRHNNQLMHQEVTVPALHLLSGPLFASANEHMLKAYEHHRHGDYRAAITEANAALESFCKIVCAEKRWTYNADRDVLSRLVRTMREHGLIEDFYEQLVTDSGTVRNRMGGHGQEPTPTYTARDEHVAHLLAINSAHMLLLAKLAGL